MIPLKASPPTIWSKNHRLDIIPSSYVLVFHLRIDNLENFLRSKIDEKKIYTMMKTIVQFLFFEGFDRRDKKFDYIIHIYCTNFALLHQNRVLLTNGSDTFRG